MEHIKEEYEDIVTNSRLVNRCGKLESLSQTENNAVIVIAIPDGDDDAVSPQLDLIESDRELRRYAKAAEHLQRPVHSRDSRLSNRSFVFFKTDD
ncbi:MAG: hypothetical protein IJ723_00720, partial [Ruminococcus sp.]|nr:hypothetical protein [Ruminococcus sp.]